MSRHDYQTCSCGAIAVDGGHDYLRRAGSLIDIIELSESTEFPGQPISREVAFQSGTQVLEQAESERSVVANREAAPGVTYPDVPPPGGTSVAIAPARNGWVLTITSSQDDEPEMAVYQQSYEHEDDVEAFADLLWFLNDEYGPVTSRYSPKRIVIRIEPGDKHDDVI